VLQTYRVIAPFSAMERYRESLWIEGFEAGDLLVVIESEEGQTTFSRWVDAAPLDDRRQFILSNEGFENYTKAE